MAGLQEHRITVPIYRELSNGTLTTHATGTLINARGRPWLVTALHAFRDQGPLWLPGKPFQRLEQTYRFQPDLDLAYLELPESVSHALVAQGGFAFVSDQLIERSAEPMSDSRCQVLGFPERTIQLDGDELVIDSAQMVMTTDSVASERLHFLQLNPRIHLAAKADELRGPDGESLAGMNMQCLSGGAFWSQVDGVAHLRGIVTDYDPKHRVVIGTRTWPLLESMIRAAK